MSTQQSHPNDCEIQDQEETQRKNIYGWKRGSKGSFFEFKGLFIDTLLTKAWVKTIVFQKMMLEKRKKHNQQKLLMKYPQ